MKLNRSLLLLIGCMLLLTMLTGSALAKEDVTAGRKQIVSKTLGNDAKFIDVNKVELGITNFGNVAYDPDAGGYQGLYYPAGQRWGSVVYTAGLWIVGDVNGDIRSASCQYSTEFQPGPILANGTAPDPNDAAYQVFKFDKPLAGEPNPVTAEAIAQGCPPEVIGDQMLYAVYNDLGTHDYLNGTNPLGVEVQQTTWGYSATGALDNVVFIRFRIINKGGNDIHDTYIAMFYDPDLGDSNDDASGADTTRGYGYVYNGDNFDDVYGAMAPAMASDFFQGPIVDAPGETAYLNDGRVLADKRVMEQTAVFHFINGGPVAAMNDPHTAEEQYYFCQGLLSDGTPLIDPTTGEETTFWFAGDPVSGEGWLYSDMMSPMDVRFGNSSGPFNLAPGDTQDIVLGIVVGQGSNPMKSIEVMRFYDEFAQKMYDANFGSLPAPPQPIVTPHALDGKIVLEWDKTAASYEQDGYAFEGYRVWQGESAQGPWENIATYDLVNAVTEIWDFEYSVEYGSLLEIPVIKAADNGLTNSLHITKDALTNTPLINGKPYYFAVTAYAYNPDATPKVYENSHSAVEVIPQRPVLDDSYGADGYDVIAGELVGPKSNTSGTATVIGPEQLTGHEYRVDFKYNADTTAVLWDLTDVTLGTVLVTDQTDIASGDFAPIVDGLKWQVSTVEPWDYGFDFTRGEKGGWESTGDLYIAGVNWGGDLLSGGIDLGAYFFGSTLTAADYVDVKLEFWNDSSHTADPEAHPWTNAQTYLRPGGAANGIGIFPGAAWDISDPDNPRQLNIVFQEMDAAGGLVDHFWNPVATGDPSYGGREYFWIMSSDYVEDPTVLYNDEIDGKTADVLYAGWVKPAGDTVTGDEEGAIYIYVKSPLVYGQNYLTFNTEGMGVSTGKDVAKERLDEINVFPNPYFAHNSAEGSFYSQFVTFNNLPEDNCDIRIFSLNGELVKTITHINGTPFERWYLQNEADVPVSSGMYFAHIDTEYGNVILKLAIVNRGAFFRNL